MAAGEEIVRASVAAGGVLSGEHGIGIEKRDYMPLMFSEADLDAQDTLRRRLRSRRRRQPAQGAPPWQPVRRGPARAGRRVDLTAFAEAGRPGGTGDLRRWAHAVGRRWRGAAEAREVRAPAGVEAVEPEEMIVRCGAGTPVTELQAALAEVGQMVALPEWPGATVGGVLAVGRSGILRLGRGPVRDALLQARRGHRRRGRWSRRAVRR